MPDDPRVLERTPDLQVPAAGCDAAIWVCSLLAWAVVCAFVLVRTHLVWVRRQLCPDLYYRFGQSLAPGTASHGDQVERYNCTATSTKFLTICHRIPER